jgi:hypothetical protein
MPAPGADYQSTWTEPVCGHRREGGLKEGRLARGIRNRLHDENGRDAPHAYPEVHHLTAPRRAHGRSVGDPDLINLWAG